MSSLKYCAPRLRRPAGQCVNEGSKNSNRCRTRAGRVQCPRRRRSLPSLGSQRRWRVCRTGEGLRHASAASRNDFGAHQHGVLPQGLLPGEARGGRHPAVPLVRPPPRVDPHDRRRGGDGRPRPRRGPLRQRRPGPRRLRGPWQAPGAFGRHMGGGRAVVELRHRQADADEARGGGAAARARARADQQPRGGAVGPAGVELDAAGCVAAAEAGGVERGCRGGLACVGEEVLRFSPPRVQCGESGGGCAG
jgi:hypothetical protein